MCASYQSSPSPSSVPQALKYLKKIYKGSHLGPTRLHTSHVGLRQRDITAKQTIQDAGDKDNSQRARKREQQETCLALELAGSGSRTFRVCRRCRVRAAAFCRIYPIVCLERVRERYRAKVPSTGAARSCEIAFAERSHPVSVGDASAEC